LENAGDAVALASGDILGQQQDALSRAEQAGAYDIRPAADALSGLSGVRLA
jgi:hypothetical protein